MTEERKLTPAAMHALSRDDERLIDGAFRKSSELVGAISEWQPIETAPKDGTHVLLATNVNPPTWVCEGYYEQDDDRGWYQANTHWTDHYDGQVWPSHWMPLPPPPAHAAYDG